MLITGEKVKDLIIDGFDGENYACHCEDCNKVYKLTYKQLNPKKRKTFFCQCKVEKFERVEDLRGKKYGDLLVKDLDIDLTNASKEKYGKRKIAWKDECVKCHHVSSHFKGIYTEIEKKGSSGCGYCFGSYYVGKKFGRLEVLKDVGRRKEKEQDRSTQLFYQCKCDCGKIIEISHNRLSAGVQSCGCLHSEILAKRNRETAKYNGDTTNPKYKRLHQIWNAMKNRCLSPLNKNYEHYGGKGITICEEWLDWFKFKEWALNNGYTDELTIDRIDYNGNYCPENCRWTTWEVQANNTSSNKMIEYEGRTQTLSMWCKELGLDYFRTKARFNVCGMTPEEAFTLEKYEVQKKMGNHRKQEIICN